MQAGKLRHSITIEKPVASRDSFGAVLYSWSEVATLRARQAVTGGREFVAAQGVRSEVSALYVCRYRAGIAPNMRLYHNGQYYEILAAFDQAGRGRELQIVCKALDSSGSMVVMIDGETVTMGGETVTMGA